MAPRTRYANAQGLSIAYQVLSDGPRDIVNVHGFVSHIDLEWEVPLFGSINERLAQLGRTVVFDKRGTGCSDRELGYGAPEDRMDDIRAVMDATDMERADLIGSSEGGTLAALFAATYPERVRRLVLYASFPFQGVDDDYPFGRTDAEKAETLPLIERHWGTGQVINHMAGLGARGAELDILARYERATCSPRVARRIAEINMAIDIRDALPAITANTLILHHENDPSVPVDAARWMAQRIPNAELVVIPGGGDPTHLSDDPMVWDVIHQFLLGQERPVDIKRQLATVLFTDIVDSTKTAVELGDERWRQVLEAHDDITERCAVHHRGRVVKSTGDGAFAVFDGPARAIRATQQMLSEIEPLGIQIRAGLHTGECEIRGDDFAGISVNIGARVSSLAGPGEIKVSSIVRDLVMGSELEFADAGSHVLKGIPGEWQVLNVV
jgi:class 3 adenylate cyclase